MAEYGANISVKVDDSQVKTLSGLLETVQQKIQAINSGVQAVRRAERQLTGGNAAVEDFDKAMAKALRIEGQFATARRQSERLQRNLNKALEGQTTAVEEALQAQQALNRARGTTGDSSTELQEIRNLNAAAKDYLDIVKEVDAEERKRSAALAAASDKRLKDLEAERKALTSTHSMDGGARERVTTRRDAQGTRADLAQKINVLEAKGVDVARMRNQLADLTQANINRQFGTFEEIAVTLQRTINLENNRLRVLNEQDKVLKEQAKGYASSPLRGTKTMIGSPEEIKARPTPAELFVDDSLERRLKNEQLDQLQRQKNNLTELSSKSDERYEINKKLLFAQEELNKGLGANLQFVRALLSGSEKLYRTAKKRAELENSDPLMPHIHRQLDAMRDMGTLQAENHRERMQHMAQYTQALKEAAMEGAKVAAGKGLKNAANAAGKVARQQVLGASIGSRAATAGVGAAALAGADIAQSLMDNIPVLGSQVQSGLNPVIADLVQLLSQVDGGAAMAAIALMAFGDKIPDLAKGIGGATSALMTFIAGLSQFLGITERIDPAVKAITGGIKTTNDTIVNQLADNAFGIGPNEKNFPKGMWPEMPGRQDPKTNAAAQNITQLRAGIGLNKQLLDLMEEQGMAEFAKNREMQQQLYYHRLRLAFAKEEYKQVEKQLNIFGKLAALIGRTTAKQNNKNDAGVGSFGENLALGVGFPLLFGGGPGSVIGSGIGSFFGTGFGGQIFGGAIGQIMDQMVAKAGALGNALLGAADSAAALREQLVPVEGAIEFAAEQARALGDMDKAGDLLASQVTNQTGDVGGEIAKGVGAGLNELQKAWNGVAAAVATTLGLLGAPFMAALTAILRGAQAIFFAINGIASGISSLLNLLPGWEEFFKNANEESLKGTQAYEEQQAELLRVTAQMEKQLELSEDLLKIKRSVIGASESEYSFAVKMAELTQLRADAAKKEADLRKGFSGRTEDERRREQEQLKVLQKQNATEVTEFYLELQREAITQIKDWNQQTSRANMDLIREEAAMRRQIARANYDAELAAIRKIEDARLTIRDLQNKIAQDTRKNMQEQLRLMQQIENSLKRIGNATLFDNDNANFVATIDEAIAAYKLGMNQAEDELAAKKEAIAIKAERARLTLQRYLEDSATNIARMNFDNALKIEQINIRIMRRQEDFQKKLIKSRIEAEVLVKDAQIDGAEETVERIKKKLDDLKNTPYDAETKQTIFYQLAEDLFEAVEAFDQLNSDANALKGILDSLDVPLELKKFEMNDKFVGISAESRAELESLRQKLLELEQTRAKAGQDTSQLKATAELVNAVTAATTQQVSATQQLVQAENARLVKLEMFRKIVSEGDLYGDAARALADMQYVIERTNVNIDTAIEKLQKFADDPDVQKLIEKLGEMRDGLKALGEERQRQIIQSQTFEFKVQTEGIDKAAEQLAKLQDPANLVIESANMIGDAFAETFKGIVDGSMSAQEAFANMTKRMADFFLDMAAQMLGEYVKLILMQTVLNAIGGPSFSQQNGQNYYNPTTGLGNAGPNFNLANGGRALPGGSYIVGERGPEIFTPDTAGSVSSNRHFDAARDSMSQSADNFAAANSEQREEQFYESMQSGGGEIEVRYDANIINDVRYVTEDQFQQGMKQTANNARAKTMGDLRNYPRKRASIGMR